VTVAVKAEVPMRRSVTRPEYHGEFESASRLNISINGEYFNAKLAGLVGVHRHYGRIEAGYRRQAQLFTLARELHITTSPPVGRSETRRKTMASKKKSTKSLKKAKKLQHTKSLTVRRELLPAVQ
jgi:hypothetical protein